MTAARAASRTGPGIPHYRLVIDGSQTDAESGHRYDTVDPFLGAVRVTWLTAAPGTSTSP